MTAQRNVRIEAVFHAAAELPPGEREAYVRKALANDAEAAGVVLELLAADEGDSMAVDRVLSRPGAIVSEQAASHPERVGAYLIESEISRGGMGRVFLGRRDDDEYESRVAIKLVRVDRESEWAQTRFREERQILARLTHPNIATLLDGGTTPEGQPYVVMQYIDGRPVDEYCRDERLELTEKLKLFDKICAAVSHAHRNLVIHRDIKPANILVAADGEPKLLDFGIAKIIDESQPPGGAVTQMGVMTPAYASPEQVRGEPVSTASDIYSLGVLLYELLTGNAPFKLTSSAPAEIVRAVCETAPAAPSTSVGQSRLARSLRGDLDNIVLKAMQKDPARRYGSADEFAADVNNYLEDRPVAACGDSTLYRAGKFFRRYAWGTAAAGLFVLTMATVITFYTSRLSSERDRAVQAEAAALTAADDARREATTANRTSQFLTGLFEAVDPRAGIAGKDLSARDLLDRGAEALASDLDDEPRTKAHLWRTVGLAYSNMGDFDPGIEALRQSLALHREHSPPEDVAEALNRLAEILRRNDRFDESVALHREAIALRETSAQGPSWGLADSYNNFGLLLYDIGAYQEAQEFLEKAIVTHRAAAGGDNASVAINMHNVTLILRVRAEFAAAEEMIRESLAISARFLGEDSAPYVVSLQQLGRIQNDLGRYSEALETLDQALARSRALYEPENPRMASIWNRMGNSHQALGHYQEAEALQRRALKIYADSNGPESWNVAYVELHLGRLLIAMGRHEEAQQTLRHSLAVRQRLFRAGDPRTAQAAAELGGALARAGALDEAAALLAPAVAQLAASFDDDHPELAWAQVLQAQSERLAGNVHDAQATLRLGADGLARRSGEDPTRFALARMEQAALAAQTGDCSIHRQHLDQADAALAALSPDHPLRAAARAGTCP